MDKKQGNPCRIEEYLFFGKQGFDPGRVKAVLNQTVGQGIEFAAL